MNWKEIRVKRLNIALMFVLMLGIGLAASVPAQAQYRDYDRNNRQSRWNERLTKEVGFLVGYLRAYTDGRQLLRYGYRPNYNDLANYRNDSLGWMSKMHHRDEYRKAYRNGYELGFREAQANRRSRYDRRDLERLLNESIRSAYGRDILAEDNNWNDRRDGRWDDRNGRWNDRNNDRYGRYDRNEIMRIAQQNGYREGQQHGNQDRARRRGYDYDDSSEYRNALVGYRSEYGDRSFYQQAFREGYRRGYDDAYRNRGRSSWPF